MRNFFNLPITLFLVTAASATPFRSPVRSPLNDEINARMSVNIATEDNLAEYQLLAPKLSREQEDAVLASERAEGSLEFERLGENLLRESAMKPHYVVGKSSNVTIEIFQNARSVGKQFLIARQYGRIRYVFAVSAAGHGRSTPGGEFGVSANSGVSSSGQLWRHMSLSYPSQGENNMDHVTYFQPAIGFHSTVFGLFANLGNPDSHGCVRLARPEARRIFALINNNGQKATIRSYRSGEPNAAELPLIKSQLAKDFNFIQTLLRYRTSADVPMNQAEYMSFHNGSMDRPTLKSILKRWNMKAIPEIPKELDLGPIAPPRDIP